MKGHEGGKRDGEGRESRGWHGTWRAPHLLGAAASMSRETRILFKVYPPEASSQSDNCTEVLYCHSKRVIAMEEASKQQGGILLQVPPGPRLSWPLLGSLPSLGKDLPHIELAKFSNLYGPVAQVWLGQVPTVLISSAQAAREILLTRDLEFLDRFPTLALGVVSYGYGAVGFAPYSRNYSSMRKLYKSEFFSTKQLLLLQESRREDVTAMVRCIYNEAKAGQPGGGAALVNVHRRVFTMAYNHITHMLLRKRFYQPNADESQFETNEIAIIWKMLKAALLAVNIGDFVPSLRWLNPSENVRKLKDAQARIDALWCTAIQEHREFHRQNPDLVRSLEYHKDVVDVLLLQEGGESLPDDKIKAVMTDMFLGGCEPPPVSIEWVLAQLLRHPHILRRAQEEVDSVVGMDRLVEESDLPNLPLMKSIVKETFRLSGPTPILSGRTNKEESQVCGYRLLPNSLVIVLTHLITKDPAAWENPHEFDPDRFLKTGCVNWQADNDGFALLPFGSGRRGCPAKSMGLLMVEYTVALLVHSFDWQPPPGMSPHDIDMAQSLTGLAVGKKVPLAARASPRLSPGAYAV